MKQRLIQQVGRSTRLKVINQLKRTQGLCVSDLAERLKMSYMGVKGICLDLEKNGLLDSWREPQKIGRPHLIYRLTTRAHDLFPTACNEVTIELLESAQRLYGPAAPEKLLLVVFNKKTDQYLSRIKGDTIAEKARSLAHVRDQEGYMAECECGNEGSARVTEHHSPLLDLLRAFPIVAKFETELFQRVLGVPVRRDEFSVSGVYCATFHCGAVPVVDDRAATAAIFENS